MLARRAACSQLRLGDAIGRNDHTARFNGRKCPYRPLQQAKCLYRPLQRAKCTYRPTLDYPLARNATFSTNLNTKSRVYLERHGGDVNRANTALALHSSQSPPCHP